ncbi:TIGR03085 family metal-binding protein [Corynebacterium sp. YIM 101645]|uniref:TIGR03085 family metal-binding protein n=1 Tax=Corynebacterium lemuris TaxID=1859292 RepID=A0ABT2FVB8_9CORY|nr:TIGR03085 family metal-binding protein [Corynebacterium lemuris]MCS5479189.1 TIGR03085 family metal-binding protein [Corynebacterium lemuris]
MSFSSAERARLADLLLELGPDAPTLCEGWNTRDMAVHLYLRENNPRAAAGMFVPAMSGFLARASAKAGERDYTELVGDWAAGPGRFNPVRFVDPVMNLAEHFVHHEDVRRGDGVARPRDFSRVVQEQLYRVLSTMAPRTLKSSTVPVILHATGFPRIIAADQRGVSADGENVLRIRGDVGELLLWVFGRDAVELKVEGNLECARRSGL